MAFQTLVPVEELARHLADEHWAVVDCRFSLAEPELGRTQYLAAHIPGSVYAHLDEDLSGVVVSGVTGRHPLPEPEEFGRKLGEWGIDENVQVVAYDDVGGAYAVRLWWMLRQLGHKDVAVLDGGWAAWHEGSWPVRSGEERRPPRKFGAIRQFEGVVSTHDVVANLGTMQMRLIDVRAPERYRGDVEPIDIAAGHIPGAISAPYTGNLDEDGRFLSADALRDRYEELFEGADPETVVFYCGSGVTSIHSLLALAHIGINGPKLYVGSWSEWIADGRRPIAVGDEP